MSNKSEAVTLDNKDIVFSWGDLAQQADGSIVAQCGGTVVLVTVCYVKDGSLEKDFLPLTVEYQEKTYAAGKIPGGFLKREGRPKDNEILCARLIDRPLRALVDWRLRHEIQIVAEVLSSDAENDPDILALNAASLAAHVSGLPLHSTMAAVRVIASEGKFIINPTYAERETATLDLIVAATKDKVVMLEGGASKETNQIVLDAIKHAHTYIQKILAVQERIIHQIKKKDIPQFTLEMVDEPLMKKVEHLFANDVKHLLDKKLCKEEYRKAMQGLKKRMFEHAEIIALHADEDVREKSVAKALSYLEEKVVRDRIVTSKVRADGRHPKDIREITCQVSVLPRTHGSAIFKRGQTQALGVTTLGTTADGQIIESLSGRDTKHFLMHYTFPPFSVGEVKAMRGVSRREIGHGALAERALQYVLPTKLEFPYTIRVVSEILESNGSSSMATVCASSLSLMDAGVPIKESVAGIAMGLVKEGSKYEILTDIAGIEDHCGDMDFKVAGVRGGITAIQLDVKNEGLDYTIIEETLNMSFDARMRILDKMEAVLRDSRTQISKYAPKIKTVKVNVSKLGELIGPGGRNIRKITRDYNVQIDIDDEDGIVSVVAENDTDLQKAAKLIHDLTRDAEVGEVFDGTVVKIMNFGAFLEILPGKSGLLHISEISDTFVKNVSDHLKEGDVLQVKVKEIDEMGRINLTRKGLIANK